MHSTLLPWHQSQWEKCLNLKNNQRLPHAWLLTGIPGMGKKNFAESLAKFVLCKNSNEKSCDNCQSCFLFQSKSHPDYLSIFPEESKIIKIDQIRQVIGLVNSTAQLGGFKIVIIEPAHQMNKNAANAILKTLEEPARNTLIFLVTSQPGNLPATIISRCQNLNFPKPNLDVAMNWLSSQIPETDNISLLLKLADGSPLQALNLLNENYLICRKNFYEGLLQICNGADPLIISSEFHDLPIITVILLLSAWLKDLLRFKATHDVAFFLNEDFSESLVTISSKLTIENLFALHSTVDEIFIKINKGIHFNKQLLLEELFIRWATYAC